MKSIITNILFCLFLGNLPLKSQCVITDVSNDWSCDGNGTMVDLFLNVYGQNLGNQGMTVLYNGTTYTLPNYSVIQNINITTPFYTTTTCSVQFPTCCLTKTFDNACRNDCEITGASSDYNCGENGGYINSMVITPVGYDLGNDGFTLVINGNTYSTNSGTAIQINNLFIPALTYTYTICSNAGNSCCLTETVNNPCFVPCDLAGVEIDQVCSNDTLTSLTFAPSGINMGIDGFTIVMNGNTYTTYGTSLEINNLQLTDQNIEYTLCCNEYPTYCHTLNFENECYGYTPPCNITHVNTTSTCTSASHYKFTMTPIGTNLGNQGFHGMVNGVAFNKNMATVVLDSLPIGPHIIYTICANSTSNCCYTDTLANPCYLPPCHLMQASAMVTCDTNSFYTIAITPTGANLGTHGFFGIVNNVSFNQDSATIMIDSLIIDSLIVFHICSNTSPTCCFNDTLANPCYTTMQTCAITGTMTSIHCLPNGMTNIGLTPQGHHLGNMGFHGVVNTIAFNQDSSTILMDSLATDSLLVFTICSNAEPNCCFTDTIVNPCYTPAHQCSIDSVKTALVCSGTAIENIVFTIHAAHAGNTGFRLYFNGAVYTTADTLIEVDSLNITNPHFTFTICALTDSTCCYTDTRLNPCDLNCVISNVDAQFNCDTLILTPIGNNPGTLGYSGSVNGISFNQPHNTIILQNISTMDSLITVHLCSNAFPTCCFTDTIVNTCYAGSKPCSLKITDSKLHPNANGYSLDLFVVQSGTCPSNVAVWKDGIYLGIYGLSNGILTLPAFSFSGNTALIKICTSETSTECAEYTLLNTAVNEITDFLEHIVLLPLGNKKYTLSNTSNNQAIGIKIYNIQGVALQQIKFHKNTGDYTVNLESLLPGLYLLQVKVKNTSRIFKIMLME